MQQPSQAHGVGFVELRAHLVRACSPGARRSRAARGAVSPDRVPLAPSAERRPVVFPVLSQHLIHTGPERCDCKHARIRKRP